jgi:autotransporter-associated beta strand protein
VIVAPSNAVVVGIGSLAGTFTLNPDIDLVAAGLLVDGAGDTVINGVISGLGKGTSIPAPPFAGPFTFAKVGAPDFDTEGWLVESGFAGSHNRGGDIALSAGRSAGDYAWDNAHPTTLLSSPPFVLDGSGDPITFELHGGMLSGSQGANTTPAPTNVSQVLAVANSDNLLGVQGVGLRRVDTGEYVLTASSSANSAADENFSWPVAGLPDTAYTFDFFDYYHGGWGWVDLDNVVLPGLDLDQGVVPDNHLVKNGNGNLTLNAINTYDSGTTVSGGVLMVHGGTGPSNVVVSSGAVLMGSGTIDGTVLVASRGGTNPGTSPGRLSVGEHLAYANYSSVFHAELQGPVVAGSDYDQLDVGGQIVLNQATLLLARDPAYTPNNTDVLTIAQGSSVTGTFNGIAEGQRISAQGAEFVVSYLNNEITLNATGGLLTYAGPDTITRPTIAGVPAAAVSVPASQLLANDLVGDGVGPLVITGLTSNSIENGSVSFDGSTVTYTAAMGYGGADSFTYTVSDGTDSAIGLVTVTPSETSTGAAATGDPAGLLTLPNGDYRITFTGTPGISYQLQWSEDLGATPVVWQVLGSVVADAQGQIILDHPAPPPRVYYRAALE